MTFHRCNHGIERAVGNIESVSGALRLATDIKKMCAIQIGNAAVTVDRYRLATTMYANGLRIRLKRTLD